MSRTILRAVWGLTLLHVFSFLSPAFYEAAAASSKENGATTSNVDKKQIREMLGEADGLYRAKRLAEARDVWNRILELDPNNKAAQVMLEETEKEYAEEVAAGIAVERTRTAERRAEEKLDTVIPLVKTAEPVSLADFMQTLSLASGIDFSIAQGAEMQVSGSFVDKTPREILDAVLLPAGLKWERHPKATTVVVRPNLSTRVFKLNESQLGKVSALMENRSLQRLLWGGSGEKPLPGSDLRLDVRQRTLVAQDSPERVSRLAAFLKDLDNTQSMEIETRVYRIRPESGPEIKALADAVLAGEGAPYDLERGVFLEGANLIVRDTPSHIQKVEDVLLDREFVKSLSKRKLQLATFSLIPRDALRGETDLARTFAEQTKEIIESFLYSEGGVARARAEGRRMWFDPKTLQLTIADYPENVSRVASFIASLPQIENKQLQKVIYLDHVPSGEMTSELQEILDLTGAAPAEQEQGQTVTKSLRTGQETTVGDLSIRLIRVNGNDAADDRDDDCELIVRTATQSQTATITEFNSQFIEDYEILVDDVRPSGTAGEGRVTLKIRYIPPAQTWQQTAPAR
ncbi:hypothetical protein JW916_13020 [Candidatus Sumerlaeota bacterium]|nr:hypothetical protein [Candidatus Sumerlaeota bacterium]